MQALKERLHLLYGRLKEDEKEIKKYKSTAFYESVKFSDDGNYIELRFYCNGGKIKIETEQEVELYLNGVLALAGEYFYLDKGEYLLKGKVDEKEGSMVKVVISGDVTERSKVKSKGVSFFDASYILCERDNEFELYKYAGESFSLVLSGTWQKADICGGEQLYFAFLKDNVVSLQKYSDGAFVKVGEFSGEDFLCDCNPKLTLYIVKEGVLYLYEQENEGFKEYKTTIKTDKIYAVRGEKIVYRDLQGNVRLNFNIPRESK